MSHFATLRNYRDGRILWLSIVLTYVIPAALGVGSLLLGIRLQALGELVGGLSLMAGFLFALVIFVFQLRLSVTRDPRIQTAAQLPRLVDELFANVTYSVVLALVATATAILSASTEPKSDQGISLGVEPWLSGILIALVAHLFAMILTCLRRTRTAYRELST